jgi:DNA-binding SARP family transcriptional activator/predicted ATPase
MEAEPGQRPKSIAEPAEGVASGERRRAAPAECLEDPPAAFASGAPAQSFRIELFGRFRITCGDTAVTSVNTNRLQSLLAFLVLHSDAAQSREHLAFLLWPNSAEAQSRTNLRQLLHHLRRALPAECYLLTSDNHCVQWRQDPACAVDAAQFGAALADAQTAAKRGDADAELQALEKAAHLYQDDLLPGLYDDWIQPVRERYRSEAAQVLARLASLFESRGDHSAAIRYVERLVAQDPLRETHHQFLIRLLAANHDRAGAIRAYHQCMRALRRELGVEPSAATRELFEKVLKSEGAADAPAELPPAGPAAPAPLVGRKREWGRLMECWNRAERGGVHLAVIAGEPGIGKSRLAEELYAWCALRQAAVARARCYAAQGQLAYAPVTECLRAEPLRAARAALPQPQLEELARVLPEVLAENPAVPRPQPLTEGWQRSHFYDSLNAVFAKARKPLLLVIDDLQWCDQDSFEWLHSLFRSELSGGVLVVGTVRSEETDRNHPFIRLYGELQRSGQAAELPLLPLDPQETAALGSQVAERPLDAAERDGLYGSTQGNPLFVIESVRAGLQDASALKTAPPRVHAVIAARLAQMTPAAYELAGLAAAAGQAFSFDLLAKATDWDEDSLSRALEELWQRRIIEGKGAAQYDFTHDRLREVAYAELGPVRKRFLHRRIAHALAELHSEESDDICGQLAAHYEAAGMAEPAIQHYRRAAAVAHQRYADSEAAVQLRHAVAICRELPQTPHREKQQLELLVALVRALFTTLGYAAAEVGETCSSAVALFRRLNEPGQGVPVLSSAWLFHAVRGQLETSKELGRQLLDLALGDNLAVSAMAGHFVLGNVSFHEAQFAESKAHFEQTLANHANCSPAGLALFAIPEVGVFCRSYLPHALWHLGYPDQASKQSTAAVATALAGSHPFGQAIALNYSAMLYVFLGESKSALARAEEAVAVCRRYEFAYYLSMGEIVCGWSRAMEGDAERGLAQLRKGFDTLKTSGAELRLPFYHGLLAEACALAGKTAEALANVSNGLAFQNRNGELWAAPHLHRIHGDLLLQGGHRSQALAAYRRAFDAAQLTGARLPALRALLRMCRMAPVGDDRDKLRTLLEYQYGQFTEGFETEELREASSFLDSLGRPTTRGARE